MAKVPKNILKLTKEEKRQFIESFDLVLNDCDGVVWSLFGPLPGIEEAISVLYQMNKELAFVSNNSFASKEDYQRKFAALGVNFDYEKSLVHPAGSFVAYLKRINFEKTVFLIGGPVHKRLLEENDFKYVVAPNVENCSGLRQIYKDLFEVNGKEEIGAVAFDIDFELNVGKIWSAMYFLDRDPQCKLLLGGMDDYYYIDGHRFPANRMWMDNVTERVAQKPIGLGKPGDALGPIIVDKFCIQDKSRVLFVGDNLEVDIGFANATGFQSMLVLSGVTSEEMLQSHNKENELPDYYANSLHDFVQFYKELND